jgi:hypothetical protein
MEKSTRCKTRSCTAMVQKYEHFKGISYRISQEDKMKAIEISD